jgi:hypothetical protein
VGSNQDVAEPGGPATAQQSDVSRSSSQPLRFVILASMRTGSNALNAHLNQFDGMVCHGEVFNDTFVGLRDDHFARLGLKRSEMAKRDAAPEAFLATLFADRDAKAVGLHMFPGHNAAILDRLLRDPGVKKIGLRRSLFQSYSSLLIVRKTNVWRVVNDDHSRHSTSNGGPMIRFVPSEFKKYKKTIDNFWRDISAVLKETNQEFYPMWYSKINDVNEINRIVKYIGLNSQKTNLRQVTKRQNPIDLREKVENWQELLDYARANGLEHHL